MRFVRDTLVTRFAVVVCICAPIAQERDYHRDDATAETADGGREPKRYLY